MLTADQIEARKLVMVKLVLTMTHQNEARTDRLEQIAICDMALKYLQAQEQEPVAWMFDQAMYSETDVRGRGWILMFATDDPKHPLMTRNVTPLFAAPVRAKSPTEYMGALTDAERLSNNIEDDTLMCISNHADHVALSIADARSIIAALRAKGET